MRAPLLAACLAFPLLAGCFGGSGADEPAPLVTIAHIDNGINPYHEVWRSDEPRLLSHPSTYIPGYPEDARPLHLSLDAATYEDALQRDAHVWNATEAGVLYYVPGTRIVGMVNLGAPVRPEASLGHGTMTASRAAGPDSLAPSALFVSIQGLGIAGVTWAADQAWIDVQTNSWGTLVPNPASSAIYEGFAYAAERMPTLVASGNGLAFFSGFVPTPTTLWAGGAPGVILVGAHDNGYATFWHGQPAHVVADGYGAPHAAHDSLDAYGPGGGACCTSAAAPYAAGGAAALILEARRILQDPGPGRTGTILAEAAPGVPLPQRGPLADGVFTVAELRQLLLTTATARPQEGLHDGLLHWAAYSSVPPDASDPGANPYCMGCWTSGVRWVDFPPDAAIHPVVGYGSIDPTSTLLAQAVLLGTTPMPERPDADAFFAADATVRDAMRS